MRTNYRRGSMAAGALLMSVGLLASSCAKGADAPPQASTEGATGNASATSPPAGKGNRAVDVDGLTLPRKVTYTGLEFTLAKATPQTDKTEGPGVALDVTVRNTRTEKAVFTPDWVGLVESDGTRLPSAGVDDPDSGLSPQPIELAAAGKAEKTFFVPVQGSLRLADTKLSVASKKAIPAETTLTGPETKSAYPIDFAVPTEPISFGGNAPITVTLKSAQLAEEYQNTRADTGKHLVVLKVRVVEDPCNCGGAIIGKGTVRLVVDGLPKDATEQDPAACCLLSAGDGKDLTLVYDPADTHTSVSMVVQGNLSSSKPEQHPIAVTIPPLPSASGSSGGTPGTSGGSAPGSSSTTSTTRR